jgi:hypothetical protein
MKNIIFFGILLLAFQHKAFSKDIEIYCLSKNSNTVFSAIVNEDQLRLNNLNKIPNKLCEMSYASADSYLQIPKKIFDEIKKEQDYWSSRAGDVKKVQENFFGLGPKTFYHYGNDPDFKRSWNEALQTKVDSKMNEINSFQTEIENQSIKQSEIENKKIKQTQIQPISNKEFKIIDSKFSKNCEGGLFSKGYKKGTVEFNECVKREEKFAALDMQKKELMNEEKNKKIALQQETQKKVT